MLFWSGRPFWVSLFNGQYNLFLDLSYDLLIHQSPHPQKVWSPLNTLQHWQLILDNNNWLYCCLNSGCPQVTISNNLLWRLIVLCNWGGLLLPDSTWYILPPSHSWLPPTILWVGKCSASCYLCSLIPWWWIPLSAPICKTAPLVWWQAQWA